MDKEDWAGFLEAFTLDAVIDTSETFTPTDHTGAAMYLGGTALPINREMISTDIAKFVEVLSKDVLNAVSTVHHGHMPKIRLTSSSTASGVWAMEHMLRWPGTPVRTMHGFGHCEETLPAAPRWLPHQDPKTR